LSFAPGDAVLFTGLPSPKDTGWVLFVAVRDNMLKLELVNLSLVKIKVAQIRARGSKARKAEITSGKMTGEARARE